MNGRNCARCCGASFMSKLRNRANLVITIGVAPVLAF